MNPLDAVFGILLQMMRRPLRILLLLVAVALAMFLSLGPP